MGAFIICHDCKLCLFFQKEKMFWASSHIAGKFGGAFLGENPVLGGIFAFFISS